MTNLLTSSQKLISKTKIVSIAENSGGSDSKFKNSNTKLDGNKSSSTNIAKIRKFTNKNLPNPD